MIEMEIFRTGQWTSSAGVTRTWTPAELAELATSYDQALAPAPLTIGHTQDLPTSAPAYGWVERLVVRGGRLVAQLGQVVPELRRLVQAGYYKTRSVEIYPPEHPANPKPGHYYLKAVAFLGAKAPAVKGLAPVQFSEVPALAYAEPTTTVHHHTGRTTMKTNFWTRLRAQLANAGIATPPLAHADATAGGGELATEVAGNKIADLLSAMYGAVSDILSDDSAEAGDKKTRVLAAIDELKTMVGALQFAQREGGRAVPVTFTEADVTAAAERARQEEREKAQREAHTAATTAEIARFCDGLKAKGQLLPAWEKAGLRGFLEHLAAQEEPLTFAGVDGSVKATPLQWMRGFLEALPAVVNFSEVAAREVTPPAKTLSSVQSVINRQLGVADDVVLKFANN